MIYDLPKAALSYAEQGYYIIPLKPISKIPLTKNGFKNASNNPEQVRKWWQKYPNANIGLVTGHKNGLFVIDVDGEYPAHLPPLDSPVKVKTGKGWHYYFKYSEAVKVPCKTKIKGFDIDIRGDGGYIVAPPSIHESGVRYEFR